MNEGVNQNGAEGRQAPPEIEEEIEKRFLVGKLPENLGECKVYEISQGYLSVNDQEETRIRRKGEKCFKQIKARAGMVSQEHEPETISVEEFEKLWEQTIPEARVRKSRLEIPVAQTGIKDMILDVYHEPARDRGAMQYEIEFLSQEDSQKDLPDEIQGLLATDVTEAKDYDNKSLIKNGFPDEARNTELYQQILEIIN